MLSFLERIFPTISKPLSDADEQKIAKEGSEKQRYALAKSEQTSQEILYYLADKDPSTKVRRAVAANPSTPLQAAPVLATDKSEDVRMILARRLMVVLPSLSQEKYSQLYAFAVQALGDLALDEVLKVRRALAETLKDHAHTPPAVALQLAKDLERAVSEPILRFCTAFSDDALIEVLQTHPAKWAAEAVAQRNTLSAPVSEAVINTGNSKAGGYLLQNSGANITPDLLENIIDRAREYPEWHRPIAARAILPPLMAEKLATYVDQSVRKVLTERSDLDEHTIQKITVIMQRRVKFQDEHKKQTKVVKDDKDPAQKAREFFDNNELTEELLGDALAMRDHTFVIESLALLTGARAQTIQTVFDAKAPKYHMAMSVQGKSDDWCSFFLPVENKADLSNFETRSMNSSEKIFERIGAMFVDYGLPYEEHHDGLLIIVRRHQQNLLKQLHRDLGDAIKKTGVPFLDITYQPR